MKKQEISKRVWVCAEELINEKGYVCTVDLLINMGRLKIQQVEDWRLRRIPYLECVTCGNLGTMKTILMALHEYVKSNGLKPSLTVYMSWGKGPKQPLRFSKSGDPHIEQMYATHFVCP